MLRIINLSKSFHNSYMGENKLFSNLNLNIKRGDFVSIIGSNGTGKSTLLNIISGVVKETSGSILLQDKELTTMPEHKRTRIISRVFQNPSLGTCPSMTVRENLSLALNKGKLINFKYCLRHKTEYLEKLLEDISLDLKKLLDVEVKYLSGGQRQALALIMASISNPKVLLLDEHTAALDPKTSNEVMNLTEKIVKEKNITTLMVTHNLRDAIQYGNRLIMLHKGEVILDLDEEEKKKLTVEDILKKFEYAV
ncbi:putative ABC transport system ATP-binding protein [Clostridium tetanomorphum]|uniref:ATP-binding cassette domain-containing protein n=1 Tax=Clostridium tetanomorphum TaxID=1553 RepID=A0A923E7H4_CLOTT|nr:ATP-binding cassette domain-containing protein [Clostridium tetanomorphum]KAJ52370.1 ABC transporter ATP-binding protein [Clostridium tetanomorphum DSM 665]MBC2397890.1 ATP-binding cassette domain-containing protein [Clostridium tetanomorphum]MBP1864794.1 putative ABC transport system ATP-binding protein [Clostridium tetanomorphum]NRS83970.1 putative ABC transport system ATP-binding protein [Clostridium tetanomorphum]NRZ97189.1 putative ABC transport system ATP-binding protein [Clostridium 